MKMIWIILFILVGCGDQFDPSYQEIGGLNPPEVLTHRIIFNGTDRVVPLNSIIEIDFGSNLSYSSLFGNVFCQSGGDRHLFYLRLSDHTTYVTVTLFPYTPYISGVTYYCEVSQEIQSIDHITATVPYRFNFTTGDQFDYEALDTISFHSVESLMVQRCVHCHQEYHLSEKLYHYLTTGDINEIPLVSKFNPAESYLFRKITGIGVFRGGMMPSEETLSLEEVMVIGGWINQGGVDANR